MIATQGALATLWVVFTHQEYCVCLQWEPVRILHFKRFVTQEFHPPGPSAEPGQKTQSSEVGVDF